MKILQQVDAAWIGLGIGEPSSGGMLGSDIFSAEFKYGDMDKCTVKNRHVPFVAHPVTESPGAFPVEDDCQTDNFWTLVSCSRDTQKGTITLEVVRPITATSKQDRTVEHGEQPMLFAYGPTTFKYHSKNRGTKRVVLFNEDGSYAVEEMPALPEDVSSNATIIATGYKVPFEASIACSTKLVPIPPGEKRFVVAADPIVTDLTRIRKMYVYSCRNTDYSRAYLQTNSCSGVSHDPRAGCSLLLYAWAAGNNDRLILPDNVGFILDNTNNFLLMETHFSKSTTTTDTVDLSGVRLYLSNYRIIEAGMLSLGDARVTMHGDTVESGRKYVSTCPSNCSSYWSAPEINVFGSIQTMRNTGQKTYTNRFDKDGNFIETISSVEFWRNNYQSSSLISPPKKIIPGDIISTTCVYDTGKAAETKFGVKIDEEQCIDYLWIYPVQRRKPHHDSVYTCGMMQVRRANFTGTLCGPISQSGFSLVKNPSLVDEVGISTTFAKTGETDPKNCPSPPPAPLQTIEPRAAKAPCFPAKALVRTRSRGVVPMDELEVGDDVLVGAGDTFSRVFMFTHREPDTIYHFIDLHTSAGRIRLTAGHMLYANGAIVRADDVRVGDTLVAESGKEVRVVQINSRADRGLYNPQTSHGDIIVDGILTSTYTDAIAPKAAHALLAPLRAAEFYFGIRTGLFEDDGFLPIRSFRKMSA